MQLCRANMDSYVEGQDDLDSILMTPISYPNDSNSFLSLPDPPNSTQQAHSTEGCENDVNKYTLKLQMRV